MKYIDGKFRRPYAKYVSGLASRKVDFSIKKENKIKEKLEIDKAVERIMSIIMQ